MIKKFHKNHRNARFASSYCLIRSHDDPGEKLKEIEEICGPDGCLLMSWDPDQVPPKHDWYYYLKIHSMGGIVIYLYLTNERDELYFSMVDTMEFPVIVDEETDKILARIRARSIKANSKRIKGLK